MISYQRKVKYILKSEFCSLFIEKIKPLNKKDTDIIDPDKDEEDSNNPPEPHFK